MTEDEARAWLVCALDVSRGTLNQLGRFVDLLVAAATTQNLIGASTIAHVWARHVVDSAQLLMHAPLGGCWVDIGSGAGFPGLVVALAGSHDVTLVESRPLRATFLTETASLLGLRNVNVICAAAEALPSCPAAVISARAVAPLDRLFATAAHLADDKTVWLLPKGRRAASELAAARRSWQGMFTMQPSVTDPEAAIVTARNVVRRGARERRP